MGRVVVVSILLRGDRVLLVKRAASRALAPGLWDLPGGHSEEGEMPEQTLVRELGEELGVVPAQYRMLPNQSLNSEGLRVYCYYVTEWTGTPSNLQEHEHSEMAWVDLTDIGKLELASPTIPTLLQAAQN